VPTGVAVVPLDVSIRSTLDPEHTIVHRSESGRGGHFAAMEAPDLPVPDVRAFFGRLRRPRFCPVWTYGRPPRSAGRPGRGACWGGEQRPLAG
jgi:hypothetical protein